MYRARLLEALREYSLRIMPAGQEFTLVSGKKSRVYIDVKRMSMRGDMHKPLASELYEALMEAPFETVMVDAVAGVALGGCHLASITAMVATGRSQLDALHVRKQAKDHGTKRLVEGPAHGESVRVALLEDVVTTGQSSLDAVRALRAEGYNVAGVLAVVDRRDERTAFLAGEAPVPFRALFTLEELAPDGVA